MKIKVKSFGLILLALYLVILIALFVLGYSGKVPEWLDIFRPQGETTENKLLWIAVVLLTTFVSQLLFVFGSGRITMARPIKVRRLILPILIAVVLMGLLVQGLAYALFELFSYTSDPSNIAMVILVANWLFWLAVFILKCRGKEQFKALKGLISALLAGSLLELVVSVFSHQVVMKRGGCLAGIGTSAAVSVGVVMLLWSFGPAILLLIIHERYRQGPGIK